ncbi:hypothetical protein J8I87_32730 [Paraburkholderia sp. LEh10]|uniref:hypothetical protein n=1 Tax=Paraburkholderia sp. LEh10 TaxID=2821353 RepID=UPI001AE89F51|nr:hypothetical protein [Paraburkholderia sp. LEh10]MBP0594349.1 hypothetical protein [Paraburkholderia sp. LEh10]
MQTNATEAHLQAMPAMESKWPVRGSRGDQPHPFRIRMPMPQMDEPGCATRTDRPVPRRPILFDGRSSHIEPVDTRISVRTRRIEHQAEHRKANRKPIPHRHLPSIQFRNGQTSIFARSFRARNYPFARDASLSEFFYFFRITIRSRSVQLLILQKIYKTPIHTV